MTMQDLNDLTGFLRQWPHHPGKMNVRRIKDADGCPKLQVRIDLGVLQMEVEGRPDGLNPPGFDSLAAMHRAMLEGRTSPGGDTSPCELSRDEAKALRQEAIQYYHRYVALFALDDFEGVIRDTTHSLSILDLCREYAGHQEDRMMLEQFRPRIIMMRSRAEAEHALGTSSPAAARGFLENGLEEIRRFLAAEGRESSYEQLNEVHLLTGMRDALIPRLPASQRGELLERLQAALDAENYELAAILRDELKALQN